MTRSDYDDKMTLLEENSYKLHAMIEVLNIAQEGSSYVDPEHLQWYTGMAIGLIREMKPVINELHDLIYEWPVENAGRNRQLHEGLGAVPDTGIVKTV